MTCAALANEIEAFIRDPNFPDRPLFTRDGLINRMGMDWVLDVGEGRLNNAMRILVKRGVIRYRHSVRMWEIR